MEPTWVHGWNPLRAWSAYLGPSAEDRTMRTIRKLIAGELNRIESKAQIKVTIPKPRSYNLSISLPQSRYRDGLPAHLLQERSTIGGVSTCVSQIA